MRIYAIGDLHLSFDERIEKPMDIFGPRWVNHHERVKENGRALWDQKTWSSYLAMFPGACVRKRPSQIWIDSQSAGQKSNHQRQSRPMVDFGHEAESVIR